jgi:hypothetical protein
VPAAPEPVALLIVRVWVERDHPTAPLRVGITRIDDVADRGAAPRSATAATVDEAVAIVGRWVTEIADAQA